MSPSAFMLIRYGRIYKNEFRICESRKSQDYQNCNLRVEQSRRQNLLLSTLEYLHHLRRWVMKLNLTTSSGILLVD